MVARALPRAGTDSPATRAAPHVLALDGLRGAAVLAVMLFHFMRSTRDQRGGAAAAERVIDWIAGGGWAGVDLFFVLSGFLITGILLRARETHEGYFRNFYARRALRILPLFYATLFFLVVLLPLVASIHSEELSRLRSHQLWFWTHTMNIGIATNNAAGDIDMFGTGHFWSLGIEEQFYLVWPGIVLLRGRRSLAILCATIVLASPVARLSALTMGADPDVVYRLTPLRLDGLALGALLALALSEEPRAASLRRLAPGAALLSLGALGGLVWWKDNLAVDVRMLTFGLTAFAGLFASMLVLATDPRRNIVVRLSEAAPLRTAGRYSYALYILHWPIATWLVTVLDVPGVNDASFAGRLLFVGIAGSISAICAWLSWHLLERHFLRLKDRFRAPARTGPHTESPTVLAELAA